MRYLFFDTETTGFPPKARLVQIAWQMWEEEKRISIHDFIVKPEGFIIPLQATLVHGITTEQAIEEGTSLSEVMTKFNEDVSQTDYIVAHNYSFDYKIVKAEFERLSMPTVLSDIASVDTMTESRNFLQLPSRSRNSTKYKNPKLSELYFNLFGENFNNAHSASADVEATVKCFFELKKRKVINL